MLLKQKHQWNRVWTKWFLKSYSVTHTLTWSVHLCSLPTRLLRGLLALCRVPVSSPQVPHRPDWGFCGWNSHRGLVFTRGPPRLYLCHKTVSTNVWRPLWSFLNDFYTFRPLNVNPLITMSKEMCLIGDVQTSEYVCVCRANNNDPSALWNGMIHPLLANTLFGVLWYQGKS